MCGFRMCMRLQNVYAASEYVSSTLVIWNSREIESDTRTLHPKNCTDACAKHTDRLKKKPFYIRSNKQFVTKIAATPISVTKVQNPFKNFQRWHLSERKKGFSHPGNTRMQLNIFFVVQNDKIEGKRGHLCQAQRYQESSCPFYRAALCTQYCSGCTDEHKFTRF